MLYEEDPLERTLLGFSEDDPFTIRDSFEGVQIFGGIGSGKTSGRTAPWACKPHPNLPRISTHKVPVEGGRSPTGTGTLLTQVNLFPPKVSS
jgi:hypothetical protein